MYNAAMNTVAHGSISEEKLKYKVYLLFTHKISSLNFFFPICTEADSVNDDEVAVNVTTTVFR